MWSRVICAAIAFAVLVMVVRCGSSARSKTYSCWSTPVKSYLFITRPCFTSPAGRVLCRCSNTTQDCSSNQGALTYIPRIFRGVQIMNFSNNDLRRLDDDQFFLNVSRDVWLVDLYNNNMNHINDSVFRRLHKLRVVLIGGNRLSYDALKPVWRIPTLNQVDLKCGHLGVIPPGYFNQTLALNLRYLDLSWNNIETLDMHELQPLQSMSHFFLWHNHLSTLTTAYMPSLTFLSFHKNRLYHFPVTCKEGTVTESLFPNLYSLNLDFNVITTITGHVCLPALTFLSLSFNRIVDFKKDLFSATRFPALINLELNEMESEIRKMRPYAFNNSRITYLGLGYGRTDFSSDVVDLDFLAGCSGLKNLFLHNNNFRHVTTERFHRFFQPVHELEILYLSQTGIESIQSNTFINLQSLKTFYLFGNALTSIPDGAFDNLTSLRNIYLNDNQINSITSQTFSSSTRNRLRLISLSGNPFHCDCSIMWFQQWMRSNPLVFEDHFGKGYQCANKHNKTLSTFDINAQACYLSQVSSVAIIMCCCILIIIFFFCTGAYGCRWRFKLCIYSICRGHHQKSYRQMHVPPGGFQFDVFLAYAEEDKEWVQNELLPILEGEWGLVVCVHQRDFIPGKHIIDNISDCANDSDRFVLVFSPHFARSQWCQFELRYCQTCVMDRDDVMVLVALQETDLREMSGAMLAVLQTTTYIEWEGSQAARTSFWGRLKLALHDVVSK